MYYAKLKSRSIELLKNPMLLNIVIVGFITILVKGVGFFKEMQVGRSYGLSEIIDTFLIASLIPGFINNVFTSSFRNVFIPNYIAETKISNKTGSFQSAFLIVTFCLAAVLSAGAYFFTVFFLDNIFSGHSAEYYSMIKAQFYILIPCILFWSISSFLGGLLEIEGLFSLSTFSPVMPSLVTLILLYFFQNVIGFRLLAIGMVSGSFLEMLFLLYVTLSRNILKFGIPEFFSHNIIILYRQLPSKIGSGLLTGSTGFVNQFFAAQLIVGSVAALNYGLKIPAFISTILIIAIGNVILPYFSNLVFEDRNKAYSILYKSLISVFIFSGVVVVIIAVFSNQIISFLFEKGNFTSSDTEVVSSIQLILLAYVPFYICSIVIIKFLTSINKNAYMLYASILNLVLNICLNYYFVKLYDVIGIAMATSLVYIINFLALLFFVSRQKRMDNLIIQ